jgi:hypothetical protein
MSTYEFGTSFTTTVSPSTFTDTSVNFTAPFFVALPVEVEVQVGSDSAMDEVDCSDCAQEEVDLDCAPMEEVDSDCAMEEVDSDCAMEEVDSDCATEEVDSDCATEEVDLDCATEEVDSDPIDALVTDDITLLPGDGEVL